MSQTIANTTEHTVSNRTPSYAPTALSIMVVVASSSFVVALLGFIERTSI